MKIVLNMLLGLVPPRAVRFVGRAQFRYPALRRATRGLDRAITARQGVIRHGVGAGLRFDATDGQPGYLLGTSEPAEQQKLAEILSDGDVFYDIGANVGFFSTLAARLVGSRGHVFAFEPFPRCAVRARHNAEMNGFRHVTVVEAAVGANNGHVFLELGDGTTTNRVSSGPHGVQVTQIAIDSWIAKNAARPATVVMLDIEGAEIDALRGMLGLLREHRPIVMCEVHWLGAVFLDFVEQELAPIGYALHALGGGAIPDGDDRWHALLEPSKNWCPPKLVSRTVQ
jgi:FkbM family methyltransferase